MQCMTTVVVTGATATGIRAWIAAKRPSWLTDRRLKHLTAALFGIAVIAAAVQVSP